MQKKKQKEKKKLKKKKKNANRQEELVNTTPEEMDIYRDSCAACHGGDLEGGAGPKLKNVGATLSAEEIEIIIEEGTSGMPGGLVADDDLRILVEWLSQQK